MSEDEDEELALLRLQALMSKRHSGAIASKDLPFPMTLTLEPTGTISPEAPPATLSVVVTSAPVALTVPSVQGISNKAGMYRQPLRGRPACSHPRFPGIRDGGFPGIPRGAPSSSNLIVIQTEPMAGNQEMTRQPSAAQRLTGPQSQLPPSSSTAPSVLLRPQDKWQAKDVTKPKPKVTKFSRYNESSDSDECDTSDSDSSSADDNHDDVRRASSNDDGHPTDAADVDVSLTLADTHDDVGVDSTNISEHSPTRRLSETEGPMVPTEQVDIPTKAGTDRAGSVSRDSVSSSLSSNGTPPSPIRSPLRLDSAAYSSSRGKFQKYVHEFRHQEQTNRRQPVPRNERSPLRRSNSLQSSPPKNVPSNSDLRPLSHPVNKTSSPNRHAVACDDRQSPVRLRSQERRLYSGDAPKSRSRSSERGSQIPPRSRYDDNVDKTKYSHGAEYSPRPHSRSPSLSAGKSPHGRPLQGLSPHQQTSLSRKKALSGSSRSRSSSRSHRQSSSRSRSRSGERFVGSSRVQSASKSRSRSPAQSPFHRQRSGSVDRRSDLPASPARYPPAADAYQDAARRQLSRSSSTDRELLTRYPRDVSPPQAAESHKLSAKLPPYRRSPGRMERQLQRPDAKSLPHRKFLENPNSNSRSSSQRRSRSPMLSDRGSHRRRSSPSRHGMKKLTGGRQDGGRYRHLTDKPEDGISRRLPEVCDTICAHPSVLRKRSVSSDRNRAISQRRSPDDRPSVHTSPLSQRRIIHDRSGRVPQRTSDVNRSSIGKKFSPSPPDSVSTETKINPRHRPGSREKICPVGQSQKSLAESEDESHAMAQKRYGQTSVDSQSKHSRMSVDQSEDPSVVERLKNLAEPDKSVQGKSESGTESTRSPHRDQSRIQESRAETTKDSSACSETVKVNTRKALTLKHPAAPVAGVLEARKRRFEQTQNLDSRSVSIRSSSDTDAASRANRHRQLFPKPLNKSKQIGKNLKEVDGRHEISSKSKLRDKKEKTSKKMQTETSDLSDLKSADSSMSLEDISEDETPRVRDKQFNEQSNLCLTQQRPGRASKLGKQGVQHHGRETANDNDDDDMDRRSSTVSSVVKSVKKDTDRPKVVTRQSQSAATEVQSTADESHTSDDDSVINAPNRNVVKKDAELSLHDARLKQQRASVHSRLGSVATTSNAGKSSTQRLVDNLTGGVVAAAKSVDLRERLRGMEPASEETLQHADLSRAAWGFPSKRRRRRRRS